MVFLVLAVLVSLTAAVTVWLIRARAPQEHDPDSTFWYAFAGFSVAAPLILIPALASNLMSLALLSLALATTVVTHKLLVRRHIIAAATAHHGQLSLTLGAASQQHDALLARWGRYELDPAATIDFPTMSDVRVPETSALIKALGAAARLRNSIEPLTEESPADDGVAEYQRAVTTLADALATAEQAAHGCLVQQ